MQLLEVKEALMGTGCSESSGVGVGMVRSES
jgi:hypothetical protein